MAQERLLLMVVVAMVAVPLLASCDSEVADLECNPPPRCELVLCQAPQDCPYGIETLPCICCPFCAQPPSSPHWQQQQVSSIKGRTRARRALPGPARRGGRARQIAKTHKLQYYADIPKEARELLERIKAARASG